MDEIARYITANLAFDRLYFYGKDKPLHISTGPENAKYATTVGAGLQMYGELDEAIDLIKIHISSGKLDQWY